MTATARRAAVDTLRPHRGEILAAALLGALATACGVGLLSLAAWLLAVAAQHPPVTALSVAVVLTRALGVGRGVARYAERLVGHDAALRALAATRDRVFARLAATAPRDLLRSGDLLTRLVTDTDAVPDLVVRGAVPVASAALAGAGAVGLATVLLVPGGAALALGLLLGGVVVPLLAARAARGPAARTTAARTRLATGLVDLLDGAADLQAHGATGRAVAAVAAADAELARTARRDALRLGLSAGTSTALAGLTVVAALLLGVSAVDAGALDAVGLAVLVLTAVAAFEVVAPLPAVAGRLVAVRDAFGRLAPLLGDGRSAAVAPGPSEPVVGPVVGPTGPTGPSAAPVDTAPARSAAGSAAAVGLRMRGVRVGVPTADGTRWVLDGLDLDVAPGERVALVGASGSGKSTLAAVLFRFVDPDAGTVTLHGRDLRTAPVDEVRQWISGSPAQVHLFDSTVRENLRLARPDATDATLASVLAGVGLAGLDLDLAVGTHGVRLSGGMRRRIALARALLVPADVLVLDEPTAHLDPDTRDAVLADLLAATRDRSVLLITHDPVVAARADRELTLRDGRAAASDRVAPVA